MRGNVVQVACNKEHKHTLKMDWGFVHILIVINWTLFLTYVVTGVWVDQQNIRRRLHNKLRQ